MKQRWVDRLVDYYNNLNNYFKKYLKKIKTVF